MKKTIIILGILLITMSTFAHRVLLMVEDNEDGTIYIEAGLSTGNVPAGSRIIIKEKSTGRPLWQGKVPNNGQLTTKQPTVPYTVTLDAGAGHGVTKEGPLAAEQKKEVLVLEPEVTPTTDSIAPDTTTEDSTKQ